MNAPHGRHGMFLLLLAALLAGCSSGFVQQVLEQLLGSIDSGAALVSQLSSNSTRVSAGQATQHSDPLVPDKEPTEPGTDIIRFGLVGRIMLQPDLDAFEMNFPLGNGPNGTTIADNAGLPLLPGYYFFAFQQTVGDLPFANPTRFYQYSAVFDHDGNTSNNYVPPAQFANDFWKGADLAFSLEKNPSSTLTLKVFDMRDSVFLTLTTASRAIYDGPVLIFMFRQEDFPSMVQYPGYRTTAFSHEGSFGIPPPHIWSGSVRPGQNDPLSFITGW